MKKTMFAALLAIAALAIGCSSSKHTTTTTTVIPAAPTGLTATAGNAQVTLAWTAVSGATMYNLYWSTTTGVTTANGTKVSGLATPAYTHTGLTNGTPYYYIVTAVNTAGESPASSQVTATPVPAAPAAPTGLTATAGNAQVALAWTAVTGAATYNVYWSTTTGVTTANGTKIAGVATASYTHTGLTNGTPYYYIVTAVNAGGESPASSQVTATPVLPAPAAPTGLTATAGNAQVALAWTAVSTATSYNLYYSTASPVTVATGTKKSGLSGTSYTLTGLTNGTPYYFILTAVNGGGESAASAQATATPTSGTTVSITPGTAASGTLNYSASTSLTFSFPANALSQSAVATIAPVTQSGLPVPLAKESSANGRYLPEVSANDTFIAAFSISLNPTTITAFNVPVTLGGSVGTTVTAGKTLNLAQLQSGAWVDVATIVVGASGGLTQNLPSTTLPGMLSPGTYLLYLPANTTSVSNLGLALVADDGNGMADGKNGLQVVHLYDANGNLLAKPIISYLDYANASDLDGQALTPDGSQGIMVDGGNTVRFFSAVQTGVPVASTKTVDITNYGGDGDSVAILPNGDEAVVSGDASNLLVLVSGILSGNPVAATTIATPSYRDGLVISNDGKILLARGGNGMTVYAIASIAPIAGSIGGTVSHSFTQVVDLTALGTNGSTEDGRDGMAISPVDSSRAVVTSPANSTIQLVTGLTTASPVVGTAVTMPSSAYPYSVSITPDGKMAIVGTYTGLLMYKGVDTGTLTQVGTGLYAPSYALGSGNVTLGAVYTLGITLDGKYVVVGDGNNGALVVVPFTSSGFATAPAAVLGSVAIPYNDQLLIH